MVRFSPLGSGVQVDRVSREAYARSALAISANGNGSSQSSRAFVKCGGALPGHRMEIRDEDNAPLPERRIGWVCISGPSLMQGYYGDPEATGSMFTSDGWLNTGDMGYLVDGELVITGRSKDLIICNGRNIWPQDLEWAVESRCGVSPGHVAAFSVDDDEGRERVVVVLETRARDSDTLHEFRREVGSVIMTMAGVGGEVVLAPPRSLTFTSSGKLSRAAAKADYLAGTIEDIENDGSPATSTELTVQMAVGAGD